ncbi:MAG: hypothetical protein GF416_08845 [Candidatus Altiarchaeales archaeon]|nr:hypothetical protein [Candidatus Altiarchaeales archaeon]MBD3417224.1 hypothetical protein [Candidatus Altiarchaeales archaeon]
MKWVVGIIFTVLACGCMSTGGSSGSTTTLAVYEHRPTTTTATPETTSTTATTTLPTSTTATTTLKTVTTVTSTTLDPQTEAFNRLFNKISEKQAKITSTTLSTTTTTTPPTTTTTIWTTPDYLNNYWIPNPGKDYHVQYPLNVSPDNMVENIED